MELELLQSWPLNKPRWYPSWAIASCRRVAEELQRPPVIYQTTRREVGVEVAIQTEPRPQPRRVHRAVGDDHVVRRDTGIQAQPLTRTTATQTSVDLVRDPNYLLGLMVTNGGPPLTLADELITGFRDDVTSSIPPIYDNIMDELFVGWAGTGEPTRRTVVMTPPETNAEWHPELTYMKR